MTIRAAVLMLMLSVFACTSANRGPRTNPDLITAEELQRIRAISAFDAIQQLRPQFLRRGPTSMRGGSAGYPSVRIDAAAVGGVEELRNIPLEIVAQIEFISPADATTRWGTGYNAGVIHVTTKK